MRVGPVYAGAMAIARLTGGPLDGQVIPLENESDDSLILPYSEGQLVYRREGGLEQDGRPERPAPSRPHHCKAASTPAAISRSRRS